MRNTIIRHVFISKNKQIPCQGFKNAYWHGALRHTDINVHYYAIKMSRAIDVTFVVDTYKSTRRSWRYEIFR